ncbi:unnamed protein product [Tetraodon nigroviridis]|uniref:(spotted green pufferfish) hypothetical protein n=1 Tax=Tetraodon nigroviridis TaxID=99883 RepID=Q4SMV0_TETNG|nr:unnamed protein product [Tetraodon nigroviridis]
MGLQHGAPARYPSLLKGAGTHEASHGISGDLVLVRMRVVRLLLQAVTSQWSVWGAGPLIGRLAEVLAHEEGGTHRRWKLMFTTPPTPSGFKYKMQKV